MSLVHLTSRGGDGGWRSGEDRRRLPPLAAGVQFVGPLGEAPVHRDGVAENVGAVHCFPGALKKVNLSKSD